MGIWPCRRCRFCLTSAFFTFRWPIFIIAGTANAVNLTDGLDGLAGIIAATAFAAFGIIAFLQDQQFLVTFCFITVGACFAFLWFNAHPAQMFMGDVGSQALGGALGVVALMTNQWLILPMIAIIPVATTLSTMLQVASSQLSRRYLGRDIRPFRMAPLHNHFVLIGWSETQIVQRWWLIGILGGDGRHRAGPGLEHGRFSRQTTSLFWGWPDRAWRWPASRPALAREVTVSDLRRPSSWREQLAALGDCNVDYVLGEHPMTSAGQDGRTGDQRRRAADAPLVAEARARGIPLTNDSQEFLRRAPATVIGITGSAGKTTTTALTGVMGQMAGRRTWVGGNIGRPLIADLHKMDGG